MPTEVQAQITGNVWKIVKAVGDAVAEGDEVLRFIESHVLHGKGIGYVDVHLLASVALTEGARIWTRDKKLRLVAQMLGCAYHDAAH